MSIQGCASPTASFEAVRGIDLEVERGQIFAVLGPNGAGKTTTVEILEGYRDRSAGEVEVLGIDPAHPTRAWREKIGIVLQGTTLEPTLTVSESLQLYAGYFSNPRPVDEVISLVGLEESAGKRAGRLSGGQQRRLDVGIALIGDPELLFLDEPTTGFDPSARRHAWEMIAGLRDLGKTVLLTTHYMDEAQFLADRVAIINRGRIVAEDTPENLGGRENLPTRITFVLPDGISPADIPTAGVASIEDELGGNDRAAVFETDDAVRDLQILTAWALECEGRLTGLEVRRPSLEDVYLQLTEA
ncbi:MAG: ABC transporter ATP-binding protein [Solirubrobacterales bacterium]|nr:ABC transporter ATP-binding protein [Solirubrobacterales bacterium]